MRKFGMILLSLIIFFTFCGVNLNADEKGSDQKNGEAGKQPIRLAVEFVDHAAAAYIAKNKGWLKTEGLNVTAFESYITGVALAAAFAKGEYDAAYMCLIPAISLYANGRVPIKVVAGTHKYGYGLLVDPKKIKTIDDLQRPDIRIGCSAEGSPPDILLHKMIDKYHFNKVEILKKIRRMPNPQILLALKRGQLDAGFCCEQFPTMGEELGFKVFLTARDLWPDMLGSVLIVRENLIKDHPETVKKLVKVTERGIHYIHQNPEDAAKIVAGALTVAGEEVFPLEITKVASEMEITPQAILRSMTTKMECTTNINPEQVQKTITYMAKLGYIKQFNAEEILDLRWLGE